MPDNAHFLAKANARRHDAALAAAHEAIERLSREGRSVNFEAVANAAGVSRAWLYREPEIRELVIRLRALPTRTTARAALRASTDSLRQRLDTARDEISRLRAENDALCATSSLVISELNACSLSASGRADHDDIDEPLRMLPAVTCLRCKTESLQGIPDPGLVITVVIMLLPGGSQGLRWRCR